MTTPAGTISLSNVQTEFGGVNPIGIDEYYRGGLYMTTNNTGVPTSGTISMSQLRSLYKTSTPSQLITAIASTPYADYRNTIFSRVHAPYGLETSTVTAQHYIDPYNVSATSITANLTFPTSFVTGAQVFLKTSYITFVCITGGYAASLASLSVNGVSRTMTTIGSATRTGTYNININYTQVAVGEDALSGMTVSSTYTKGAINLGSIFNVIALPGKWDLIGGGSRNENTTAGNPAVSSTLADDLVIGSVGIPFDGNYNATGTVTGVTTAEIARRSTQWYTCHVTLASRITVGGTAVYNTGFYTSGGGDTPVVNNYYAGVMSVFRCSQG